MVALRAFLLLILSFVVGCSKPEEFKKPNVLVILIDTLRADHLGYAGYKRDTSPNIDAFAKQSAQFNHAYAGSSWTAPSVASLFTGLPPSVHGMMPPNSRTKAADKFQFRLSNDVTTIAESLKADGYKTAAVTSNEWISEKFGYAQGFDYTFMKSRLIAENVNEKAFRVIDKFYTPDQPFFLYVHYIDPHDPYKAPEPYREFFKDDLQDSRYGPSELDLIRAYDNEIRYVDHYVGELLKYSEAKGLLDNTLVILTADHGEQFRERGNVGHGFTLHDEETRIPLLIRFPGKAENRLVEEPVSHLDVFPTILDVIKAKPSSEHIGISLASSDLPKHPIGIISEVSRKFNFKSVVRANLTKVIGTYDVTDGLYAPLHSELKIDVFNLKDDPFELKAGTPTEDDTKDYFGILERLNKDVKKYKIDTMEMSEDTFNELKTLGYF